MVAQEFAADDSVYTRENVQAYLRHTKEKIAALKKKRKILHLQYLKKTHENSHILWTLEGRKQIILLANYSLQHLLYDSEMKYLDYFIF